MVRPLFRLAAFAVPLLVAASAAAQDAGTSLWAKDDFAIRVQSPEGDAISDVDLPRFFNRAVCNCDDVEGPEDGIDVFVFVGLTPSGAAKRMVAPRQGNMQVFIGTDCSSTITTDRERRCLELNNILFATFLNQGTLNSRVSARAMSTDPLQPLPDGTTPTVFTPNPTCTMEKREHVQTMWVVLDTDNNGTPDTSFTNTVRIDLTPPQAPDSSKITVGGGNQAVTINWTGIDFSTNEDLLGYQILCNRAGELQVFADGTFEPALKTCAKTVGAGVEGLHPNFVCSPLLGPSTGSYRVKILQNDITYGVAVVAVDKSGNASIPDVFYQTAFKTKSFYDVYRDCYNGTSNGECIQGEASGGMCTLAPGRAATWGAATVAVVLAAAAAVVVRRRRRR